jgi:lipoyl(octanoyl) transferase
VLELGSIPYRDAWALQRQLHAERVAGRRGDSLLLLEHPPVVTLGRTGGAEFLLGPGPLVHPTLGPIEVVQTDRGGKVTYHGPGQLVGYGIVSLAARRLLAASYVHAMESVLVTVLGELGLEARAVPGRVGVWIAERKIASIGVRITEGVSLHGFALNVDNDLSPFALMHPCGLVDVQMTSTRLEGVTASRAEIRERLARAWIERFPRPGAEPSA